MTKPLSHFKEQISDDFQSTFTVVSDNVLANMMGFEGDFEQLTSIVNKYIPEAKVKFTKTNQLNGPYDVYLMEIVND